MASDEYYIAKLRDVKPNGMPLVVNSFIGFFIFTWLVFTVVVETIFGIVAMVLVAPLILLTLLVGLIINRSVRIYHAFMYVVISTEILSRKG